MKVFLDSVGCRLNQSELETYARQLRAAGHDLVSDPAQADVTVVNTCTVTVAAAADSRKKIRRAARAGCGEVVVTGCWSTLLPQRAASLPGVGRVIPNAEKDTLVAEMLGLSVDGIVGNAGPRVPIPGPRMRTRAFIKAQDGCDNHCSFCITKLARGPSRSLPVEVILADVDAALAGGSKEVILTGVNLGAWGRDLDFQPGLAALITAVLEQTDVPRLRVSSLEPWDLDAEFFDLWQDERLGRHLHLPLQSGCAATLRRMARATTPAEYAALVETARRAIPDVAITTDIIVGFPGESEAEFEESLAFVRRMEFAGGHVFTYSKRPGTAAARLPDPVPHPVRKERNAAMRAVLQASEEAYAQQFVGQRVDVLWERADRREDGWRMEGLSGNYLRVHARAETCLHNQISTVRLTGLNGRGLAGSIEPGNEEEAPKPEPG
jgi:threonylcarbamoyladenosine tRNA methylthiotransferase MtaB